MSNQQPKGDAESQASTQPVQSIPIADLDGVAGGARQPKQENGFVTLDVKSKPQPNELQDIIAIL